MNLDESKYGSADDIVIGHKTIGSWLSTTMMKWNRGTWRYSSTDGRRKGIRDGLYRKYATILSDNFRLSPKTKE